MLPEEELHLRHNPPEGYPLSAAHWRQAIDAYAAELAPPIPRTWGKRMLRDIFDTALQVIRCWDHVMHDQLAALAAEQQACT